MTREVPPISIGAALPVLFDYVDLRPARLDAALPRLELTLDDLADTHIHLGHKELYNKRSRTVKGQCIKQVPLAWDEARSERAKYVDYLIPGFDTAKVANTTFVALDLPGITTEILFKESGLLGGSANLESVTELSDMMGLEQAVCREASRVLMHELLHVPLALPVANSEEEYAQSVNEEESFIDEKLKEIGIEGVPPRLVNVRFSRKLDVGSLFMTLYAINQKRHAAS